MLFLQKLFQRIQAFCDVISFYVNMKYIMLSSSVATSITIFNIHIDGLVQERRNFIANAVELRLSCINSSILLTFLVVRCKHTWTPLLLFIFCFLLTCVTAARMLPYIIMYESKYEANKPSRVQSLKYMYYIHVIMIITWFWHDLTWPDLTWYATILTMGSLQF